MTNNINTNNPTLTTDIIHTELSPQRSLISEVSNAIFSDITNAKTQEVSPLNNVVIPNQPASAIKPTLVVNNNMAYTVSVFLDSLSQSTFFDDVNKAKDRFKELPKELQQELSKSESLMSFINDNITPVDKNKTLDEIFEISTTFVKKHFNPYTRLLNELPTLIDKPDGFLTVDALINACFHKDTILDDFEIYDFIKYKKLPDCKEKFLEKTIKLITDIIEKSLNSLPSEHKKDITGKETTQELIEKLYYCDTKRFDISYGTYHFFDYFRQLNLSNVNQRLEENGCLLSFSDKNEVLFLLNYRGDVLNYLSDDLKKDEEFFKNVCIKHNTYINKIPKIFSENPDFWYEVLKNCNSHFILYDIPDSLRCNLEFIIKASKIRKPALLQADKQLYSDPWFAANKSEALFLVSRHVDKFKYLPKELQDDEDFCKDCCKINPESIDYIPAKFSENPDFWYEVLKNSASIKILDYIPNSLKCNLDFIVKASKLDLKALIYADKKLYSDPWFAANKSEALFLVSWAVDNFKYLPKELQDDEDFCKDCCKAKPESLQYIPTKFSENPDFVIDAMKDHSFEVTKWYCPSILLENLDFIAEALATRKSDICEERTLVKNLFTFTLENRNTILYKVIEKLLNKLPKEAPFNSHVNNFCNELKNYKNLKLLSFFCLKLSNLSIDQMILVFTQIENLTKLTAPQKRNLIVLLTGILLSPESSHNLIDSINPKLFKDFNKIQILLDLLIAAESVKLPKKYDLISAILKQGKDVVACMQLFKCLILSSPEMLENLKGEDVNKEHLFDHVIKKLRDFNVIPENIDKNFAIEIFNQLRSPESLFSYVISSSDDTKALIKRYIDGLLNGTFTTSRNQNNSHASFMSESQKLAWQTALEQAKPSAQNSTTFDPKAFLITKLVTDGHHGNHHDLVGLASILKGESTDQPTDLQKMILNLTNIDKKDLLHAFEELKTIFDQDEELKKIEFINDINHAIKELSPNLQQAAKFSLVDSDHTEDLFLCGTEVTGSCQRVDGDPHLNRALMGYVLDGKTRILAVKNSSGNIISRALVKVLLNEQNKPVLFFERVYGSSQFENALIEYAKEKATQVGIPIYTFSSNSSNLIKLYSKGNTAGIEYEDAGIGISNGEYKIYASEL